jgi:choline-glycine betaine transporter
VVVVQVALAQMQLRKMVVLAVQDHLHPLLEARSLVAAAVAVLVIINL